SWWGSLDFLPGGNYEALVGQILQQLDDIGGDDLTVGDELDGQRVDDGVHIALAIAELQDFDGNRVWRQDALGDQQDPATTGLVMLEAGVARQHRPAFGRHLQAACGGRDHAAPPGSKAPGGTAPST